MNLPRISNLRLRTRIILGCAIFGILGVLGPIVLLPHFVDLDALKTRISAQVAARLEGDLQTDRLEWAWLPLPHLNLRNTRFANEETALTVPMAKVYPDWWSLFRGQVRIGKVVLISPEIRVK
ncbi:MAG: AsmA family protein, partial [Desulfurivibrionaceae bacterium]